MWLQVGKTTELSRRERFATFHLLYLKGVYTRPLKKDITFFKGEKNFLFYLIPSVLYWENFESETFKMFSEYLQTFPPVCREEIEKQRAHERYMRLQEQGKTDQAKKDLGTSIF